MNRHQGRLAVIAVVAVGGGWQNVSAILDWRENRRLFAETARAFSPAVVRRTPVESGLNGEAAVADAAQRAAVGRLLGVSSSQSVPGEKSIEWEAGWASSLTFVRTLEASGALGGLSHLQLTAQDGTPGLLRGRGSFSTSWARAATSSPPKNATDIFRPLWRSAPRPAEAATARQRNEDVQRRQEAAKAEAEQKRLAQTQALDNRKHEFETRYALTGIASNGKEIVAFIDGGVGRTTVMVRTGDALEDARVESIDEKAGSVRLVCPGQFSVTLRVGEKASGRF